MKRFAFCFLASSTAANDTIEGKIIWRELLSDTPAEFKTLYSELFGWQFEDVALKTGLFQSLNYTLIRHNGKLIGGMVDQTRLETKEDISQWVVLLSVKDIDAAVNCGPFKEPALLYKHGRTSRKQQSNKEVL